jgi:integrase
MADQPPRLRLVPADGAGGPAAPKKSRRSKPPPNLYQPDYPCRGKGCPDCSATPKRTCRQKKVSKTWWCRFSVDGFRKPFSTGCRDERNAKVKAAQIRVALEAKANGVVIGKRERTRDTIEPFAEYLSTFRGGKRHRDDEVRILKEALGPSINKYIDDLGTEYARWLTCPKTDDPDEEATKDDLRNGTKNDRIAVLKRYGKFLLGSRRLTYDPFALLVKLPQKDPKKRRRRALKPSEMVALLRATLARPLAVARAARVNAREDFDVYVRHRREGRVRAFIYRLVCDTGLRRGEITRIRIKDVNLGESRIYVPPLIAKAKCEQSVVLNSQMHRRVAAYLRTLKGRDRESPMFAIVEHATRNGKKTILKSAVPSKHTFDLDLAAAAIPKVDDRGRVVDFHALRNSYITLLNARGAKDSFVQRMARHSDIRLTMGIYTDEDHLPLHEVAELLVPEKRRRRTTGREG